MVQEGIGEFRSNYDHSLPQLGTSRRAVTRESRGGYTSPFLQKSTFEIDVLEVPYVRINAYPGQDGFPSLMLLHWWISDERNQVMRGDGCPGLLNAEGLNQPSEKLTLQEVRRGPIRISPAGLVPGNHRSALNSLSTAPVLSQGTRRETPKPTSEPPEGAKEFTLASELIVNGPYKRYCVPLSRVMQTNLDNRPCEAAEHAGKVIDVLERDPENFQLRMQVNHRVYSQRRVFLHPDPATAYIIPDYSAGKQRKVCSVGQPHDMVKEIDRYRG